MGSAYQVFKEPPLQHQSSGKTLIDIRDHTDIMPSLIQPLSPSIQTPNQETP